MSLLSVEQLEVGFALRKGTVMALRNISFSLERGERLGIVGESGAGKSVLGFSILNLIAKPGYIAGGKVVFAGQDLTQLSSNALREIRGNRIAMIFQDPMVTLNPVLSIGEQMIECLLAHRNMGKEEARSIALRKLQQVQIPSPETRLEQYPHELAGGMRQRVVIAIALLLEPELIIADEPTTALDVTIQAEIMELMVNLCEHEQVALILITHDLGVVSEVTEKALVMYAGRIVEYGPTEQVIRQSRHPYTQGLLAALPQMTTTGQRLQQIRGSMPGLQNLPAGCAFQPRCDQALPACQTMIPAMHTVEACQVACHLFNSSLVPNTSKAPREQGI